MKYLVGLTADDGGKEALGLGPVLTATGDVDLAVCLVVPETWGHPSPARVDAEYAAYVSDLAERTLAEARAALGESVRADYLVRPAGSATEGLTAAARESGAALLVVGSACHGPLGRFMVGSVTNELLHSSPIPVALAPRGYRPGAGVRLGRVTCAFTGSSRSHASFDAAVQLCRRHEVPLRVASLVDRQMYPTGAGYDAERLVATQWREQAEAAQERATGGPAGRGHNRRRRRLGGGTGSLPWEDGEVLAMGSSRLGPVAQLYLGSNATKIVRSSPAPTVVVARGAEVDLEQTAELTPAR